MRSKSDAGIGGLRIRRTTGVVGDTRCRARRITDRWLPQATEPAPHLLMNSCEAGHAGTRALLPMKPNPVTTISAMLVLAGFAAGVWGQGSQADAPQPAVPAVVDQATPNGVSQADRAFIEQAAQGGLFEIRMGSLAAVRGASQVASVGKRMIKDHEKADQELKQIAAARGIDAPGQLDDAQRRQMQGLRDLDAHSFDRDYLQQMIEDHREAIALYEREAQSGQDPALKAYAARTLPTLREHLQRVEMTSKALKAAGKSSH